MVRSPTEKEKSGPGKRLLTSLLPLAACGLTLLGAQLGTQVWGVQARSDPTKLQPVPGFKGVAVALPRGEVLVLRLLQDLSNYIGEPVYAEGAIHPAAKITLEERPTRLDVATVKRLLEKHQYGLTREEYRGQEVYWVQKLLVPKRRKGSLRPSGSLGRDRDVSGTAEGTIIDRGRDTADGSLCLYQRQEGEGPKYVVLFETSSKRAAEDALSLLQAHQRSRKKSPGGQ